ncbi:S8 family serine peptidase [Hyphobacterium sp. HN65]|uniref:S8 family serine peptidase n=1 Tax=Hyphobacterium lacteum TaxID=3116575 RepID=A0ABU7LNH3_9PROT|nr:S8 family serine peptidase [Hyphobacterium sp. HN65]MEE2525452.1 S8 family serine peptidase [Hyphobacterium sp. HN65]
MLRVILLSLVLGVFLTPAATAQTLNITPDLQEALQEQPRVRVFVFFDIPQLARDGGDGFDLESQIAQMDASRDAIIERSLGVSPDMMAGQPLTLQQPGLMYEYSYVPAAAMYLSAAEIDSMLRDPAVSRIELDRVSYPLLDTSVDLVGARNLHTAGLTGSGVSVAILDSGVDHQHPMFAGRIVGSACFSGSDPANQTTSFCPNGTHVDTSSPQAGDNCEDLEDDPENGGQNCHHGTHVAGIAAGADFENPDIPGQFIRGVAPGANIVAVNVFSRQRNGNITTFDSDQAAALEWLYNNRNAFSLASINMSLGGSQYRHACRNANVAPWIRMLRSAGVATVIASGNARFRDRVGTPSCIAEAITVGSTTDTDELSLFSNSGYPIDLLAPGSAILSAFPRVGDTGPARAQNLDGTSMASPHVAGAFALLRAAHPDASVDMIENALEATGRVITAQRYGIEAPRIQVDAAHAQLTIAGNGALGNLSVSPIQPFDPVVSQASPITRFGQVHTLRNTGNTPLNWTISSHAGWIRFSQASPGSENSLGNAVEVLGGRLEPGASTTVFVLANATGMNPGAYQSRYQISTQASTDTLSLAARMTVLPAAANDNFSDAAELALGANEFLIDSTTATTEAGEGNHGVAGTGATVWYRWTANYSGLVGFVLSNPNFDPVIAVYTGNSIGALSPEQSQGDTGVAPGTGAPIHVRVFESSAGETYHIAVAGQSATGGEGLATLRPILQPENDMMANATVLTGSRGHIAGTTYGATTDPNEPVLGIQGQNLTRFGHSVWFRWTAPMSGPVWFGPTLGTQQTVLVIFDSDLNAIQAGLNGPAPFNATAGQTYLIFVDGPEEAVFDLPWAMTGQPAHRLVASVLPTVRTGQVGQPTTAFATVINPAGPGVAGENCRIDPPFGFNGDWTYQTTDPATNTPTGQPNTPVTIPPGGAQTFILSLTPSTIQPSKPSTILRPIFRCDTVVAAGSVADLNTLRFSADDFRNVDIAAVAATIGNSGAVEVPLNGGSAFSMALRNVGLDGENLQMLYLVNGRSAHNAEGTPEPISAQMPLRVLACETNPATGQCLAPPSQMRPQFSLANGQVRTFSFFVQGQGIDVANAPDANRITVFVTDADDDVFGGTSVAVRTVPDP